MNKKALLTLPLMMFAFTANAQTETSKMALPKRNAIKPYIGVGSFNITGAASDFSAKSGIVAGATYEFVTGIENLSMETGLEYLQAGTQREYVFVSNGQSAIKQELDMNYVTIPVKARYQVFDQGVEGLKYKALGGLTVAQLISAKSKTEVFGVKDDADVTSDFNTTDILASVGVGAEYDIVGGTTSLDVEYTRGMLEVAKDGGGNNEGVVVKLGFAMPL